MKRRFTIATIIVLGLTAGLIGAFVFWSPWPPAIGSRIYFMILAMAVVGIPFGIKYGTQEKFWT
ncbi:MAG: hypothetical protein JWO87_3978 [Phycisphaerales bacterium]|nr:hypothetical protein [Phycisphaerales bacterium]